MCVSLYCSPSSYEAVVDSFLNDVKHVVYVCVYMHTHKGWWEQRKGHIVTPEAWISALGRNGYFSIPKCEELEFAGLRLGLRAQGPCPGSVFERGP